MMSLVLLMLQHTIAPSESEDEHDCEHDEEDCVHNEYRDTCDWDKDVIEGLVDILRDEIIAPNTIEDTHGNTDQ
jgi:hypothetical protein